MELRHLRYFLAVAEELHFTRAAARLGIQQPPLSQQIRQLEDELGTKLFRRLTRGVELTESGVFLLKEARLILNQVEHTKAAVQGLARGTSGHIRVGFSNASYFNPVVSQIICDFRERYPNVVLTPFQSVTAELVHALHEARVDVAFLRAPFDDDGLASELIVEEPLVAVVPEGHPLAAQRDTGLAALAKDPFLLFPRATSPGFYDSIISACQQAGFSPKLGQEAPDIPSLVHLVGAGFGVSVVPQALSQISAQGVVYLPISGERPMAWTRLGSRRNETSEAVKNFISTARRHRIVGSVVAR
ncbi:LysR family transcriptional regulator [Paucibacter sp. R3-3]|uniref:LysR family transcriptional regulator n=1 Tax=Roseateles agri TaxID=3098619 RepID=A0ABU5DNF0_9BURK|nr:LysR family transcriptional regulator [Paucibacter sp. R3-3]MDY0746819.1 LysR family transcriptional regulator [Paucibacter sp. R3-3]